MQKRKLILLLFANSFIGEEYNLCTLTLNSIALRTRKESDLHTEFWTQSENVSLV